MLMLMTLKTLVWLTKARRLSTYYVMEVVILSLLSDIVRDFWYWYRTNWIYHLDTVSVHVFMHQICKITRTYLIAFTNTLNTTDYARFVCGHYYPMSLQNSHGIRVSQYSYRSETNDSIDKASMSSYSPRVSTNWRREHRLLRVTIILAFLMKEAMTDTDCSNLYLWYNYPF